MARTPSLTQFPTEGMFAADQTRSRDHDPELVPEQSGRTPVSTLQLQWGPLQEFGRMLCELG